MKYTGSTPMPNIDLTNAGWISVPIACLHSNIQEVLRNIWKEEGKFVMFNAELSRIAICLHTRGSSCAILYFE